MKLVFCGTPAFAVPVLDTVLDAGHQIALVLTQPDRPSGRKLEIQAPPVKAAALNRGLRVLQPEKIKTNAELRAELGAIQPDAILVVAYGRIIPGWMLELPPLGNINLHGSLLPKYRGAAPVQWAVANGEAETGVTTMLLDAGLDTGDVLLEARVPIGPGQMATELLAQLSVIGAGLMIETLEGLASGHLVPKPQNDAEATLARILTREDGRIDPHTHTARQIYDHWRGFYPWPGAYAEFRGKRLLFHQMELQAEAMDLAPAELRFDSAGRLLLGAAEGTAVALTEMQPEGKSRLSAARFAREYQLRPGERLD